MRAILLLSVLLVLAGLSFSVDVGSCDVISSPGTYVLNQSVSGAPNSVTSGQVDSSCIVIDSSNVVFDCNGFSITTPSAPSGGTDTAGIFVNQNTATTLTGITIRNCPNIQNYSFHIYAQNMSSSSILNNTVYGTYPNFGIRCDNDCSNLLIQNNTVSGGYAGIDVLFGGSDNLIDNNRVFNNDVVGIEIQSNDTNVTNNLVSGGGTFFTFYLGSGTSNARFENNNATDVGIGFYIQGDNSVFINDRASNNADFSAVGFSVGGSGNTITQSIAYNNSNEGFSVGGTGNTLTSNLADLNGVGFSLGGSGHALSGNNATNNLGDGFTLYGDGNTLTSNIAHDNVGTGFHLRFASFNLLDGNTAYLNGGDGFHLDDSFFGGPVEVLLYDYANSYNNLTGNLAYNNSGNGYRLTATDNNLLSGNNATDNTLNGFLLETGLFNLSIIGSESNTLSNDRATGNGLHGLFIDSSNGNTVSGSTFCLNQQYGVFLNFSNSSAVTGNVACDQPYLSGIYLLNSTGDTLTGNEAYGNGDSGIALEFSDSNTVSGNAAHDNVDQGFEFDESDSNTVSGNSAYANPRGFELREAALNTFSGNEAYNNTGEGFALLFLATNNNVFTGDTAHDNGDAGFAAGEGPHDNSFMDGTSYNNLYGYYLTNFANNNYLSNDTAYSNTFDGFRVENTETNLLEDNLAYGNGDDGFILTAFMAATDNTLTGNVAHDNANDGFEISGDVNNTLTNNTAYNNYRGFHLFVTSGNLLQDNLAYGNTGGFALEGADANLLLSNTAENNSGEGISVVGSFDATNNTLTGNTVCGNNRGIFILFDYDNTLANNTVCNNAAEGVTVELSTGNNLNNDHLYGNSPDFLISTDSSTPTNITLNHVIFDSDSGNLTNYTDFSLSDNLEFGETTSYSIDHAVEPAPLPPDTQSFAGKFLEIADLSLATHALDRATWHWLDSESSGLSEQGFRLWRYNGTWTLLPAPLDQGANTLTLTNHSGFSVFAILQTVIPPGGDEGGAGAENPLAVSVNSSLDGNIVTVTSDGTPIEGANVLVDGISVGLTNSSGQVTFPGCSDTVTVKAKKDGYADAETGATLVQCPACTTTQDCPVAMQCVENLCVPVPCACGAVSDHQCVSYQCCADTDCAADEQCLDHSCKPKEAPQCTSDLQCDPDQFCDIPPGLGGGACKDLCADGSSFCQCSNAVDHVLVPTGWECGDQALGCQSCPAGQQCVDHKCVAPDLSCPSTGIVGDQKTCNATDCPLCDYLVGLPNGQNLTGKTGPGGEFGLPLNMEGTYRVTLLRNGTPVKTVEIKALPKGTPGEEEKPTGTGFDAASILWLLIIIGIIALAVFLWRSRQGKKG